jgi:hypothetical protein
MYASMPALSAVHAAVLTDERLAQLKAQARVRCVCEGALVDPGNVACQPDHHVPCVLLLQRRHAWRRARMPTHTTLQRWCRR